MKRLHSAGGFATVSPAGESDCYSGDTGTGHDPSPGVLCPVTLPCPLSRLSPPPFGGTGGEDDIIPLAREHGVLYAWAVRKDVPIENKLFAPLIIDGHRVVAQALWSCPRADVAARR